MSKFNSPKRLAQEDFPSDQQSWLPKLLDPLNQFMEQVAKTFTQGIVIADNMKGTKIVFSITENQTYPMKYNLSSLKDRPVDVHIGYINTTDGTSITSAYSVYWTYDDGMLSYTMIGLDSSKKYTGNLIVLV